MILTVTLNAAVARTLVVPSLTLGHRHRAPESVTLAGGKGINVARSLRTLGVPVLATGFAGGRNGDVIRGGDTLRPRRDRGVLADLDGHHRPHGGDADGDQRVRTRGEPFGGPGVH